MKLEPSPAELRRMIELATERIVRYVETLPEQKAIDSEGAVERSDELIEDLPESGTGLEPLLDDLFERWIPKGFNTASPGYLAYIPGGGLVQSAVSDLIASAVNRYVGVFAAAPALVQLETNVIRWFTRIIGMPEGSGGVLTTGGSMANLIAIVTARRERLPEDFLGGTIYVSDQVHHSVQKAAILAGFPFRNIRSIETDGSFRMRIDRLRESIRSDRGEGLAPFMIIASAGTTNTGAIDPLGPAAALARSEKMWLHVDAAYGGFFMLTERGRERLAGIERADSLSLDPHKGLFVPYGSGSILVRDPGALRRAHSLHADYLPEMQQDDRHVDFCEISPELSRGFRGLRVWLPIKLAGIGAFRHALDEKLDLAGHAHERLASIDGIEIVAPPQLSVVAFRFRPPGVEGEDLDRLNRGLMERVNRRGRVYLTGTRLRDRFAIRICVLSFRTHRERVDMAIDDIEEAARAIRPDD